MKKNLFLLFGSVLLMLFIGCKKQPQESANKATDVKSKTGNNANLVNHCRLLVNEGLSDGFIQAYRYNEAGLANEYKLFLPGIYDFKATIVYGNRGEVTNARFYYTPDVFYDIVFTYDKGKIITEIWYVPGTTTRVDGYTNSYNKLGQLVNRDNPDYNLFVIFYYDAQGNPVDTKIFDNDGNFLVGYEQEYTKPIKNPFLAVPGIPESIFFASAMEGPQRFTGLKQYFNDEQGNPVVFFDWKSAETKLIAGDRNLAAYQNSKDDISGTYTEQTWTYENCAGNSAPARGNHAVAPSPGNTLNKLLRAKKTSHYKQNIINFKKAFLAKGK